MAKPRSIFEEVSENAPKQETPKGGLIDAGRTDARRGLVIWLSVLFAMVLLMIVIGGLTRLTDSGLSITEWALVKGAVPPLNLSDWTGIFEKYKNSPEYIIQNNLMTLEEFKNIYWWEWGHRQLGRLVGVVWLVGIVGFSLAKRIPKGWTARLTFVGLLGGLQGAIGWWMVSSGLTGRMVDVASYRLAIHLGLAFIILCLLAWYIWQLKRKDADLMQSRRQADISLALFARILLGFAFAQILLGALVAGIDAGRGYIDWPMMNGEFLPSESFEYSPFWTNFFENPALVQFNHRIMGYILFLLTFIFWFKSRKSALRSVKRAFDWVAVVVFGQMVLGIGTMLYAAPWHIAIIHQLGAVVVMVLILRACFTATYPIVQSLR